MIFLKHGMCWFILVVFVGYISLCLFSVKYMHLVRLHTNISARSHNNSYIF